MPKVSPLITNFSSGELTPRLDGRIDIAKYPNGCATLENAIIWPQGGASRRDGLHFVAEVKDSTKQVRLIEFEFSTTQAYVLEFGDQYIRFYRNNGQVVTTTGSELVTNGTFGSDIASWTDSSVGTGSIAHDTDHMNIVSTDSSNYGYAEQGITTVDDTNYQLDFTVTGGSLTLVIGSTTGGTEVKTATSYAAGTHNVIFTAESTTTYIGFYHQESATIDLDDVGCKESIPYEISTTYLEADLFEISYAQEADVLYLAHRDYAPRKLTRTGHTSWTLTTISFTGSTFPADFCAGAAGTGCGAVRGGCARAGCHRCRRGHDPARTRHGPRPARRRDLRPARRPHGRVPGPGGRGADQRPGDRRATDAQRAGPLRQRPGGSGDLLELSRGHS